ncbi:MAG: heparan N-sulfatase [Bacteroidetes bacterium]|nr:MAG: heparan N-sulfatase [Bacteroidota bacterium]
MPAPLRPTPAWTLPALLVLLVLLPASGRPPVQEAPPNILVLVADDLGWFDSGPYGNPVVRTPNLDRLAASGLRVDQAFLTIAQCSPSRISILSGRYPHQTGAEDLHMPMPDSIRILPSYLKRRGYFTGHLRKRHYGPHADRQFDWYDDWETRSPDTFGRFLDEAGDRPFFLWVGFSDPHRPYQEGTLETPHDPADVILPPHLVDAAGTRADRAQYYDEIGRMDGHVGRFLDELEARGLRDNTLVVFLSDNGAPFPREKGTVYDAGIRTPLLFSWPAVIPPGSRYGGLVSVIDLAPTLLDVAGLETPSSMAGRSLRPIFTDLSTPGREYVFAERNWHNCDEHIRAVRTARFKLILNAYTELPLCTPADASNSPSWFDLQKARASGTLTPAQARLFEVPRARVELYDLENDPNEYVNVAHTYVYAEVARDLARVLDAWMKETHDFSPLQRRRPDNTDRITGVKFTRDIPPMYATDR